MIITDEFKKNFKFYNQAILIYSFILGIAYIFGYWRVFDINIFPFISLFDLVKFSAYPLLILYIPFLLFQWSISEFSLIPYITRMSNKLNSFLVKHPRKIIRIVRPVFILIYFTLIIGLGIYLDVTTLMVGVPVVTIIGMLWLFNIRQKHDALEVVQVFHRYGRTLLFFALLPFVSYDHGHHKAMAILKAKEYSYIFVGQNDRKLLYKFLGFVDNHYFFLDKNNHVLLINNNVNNLELRHFLKKGGKDSPEIGYT